MAGIDALRLLGEADALVKHQGFKWSRGRPSKGAQDKNLVQYLARKYGVSSRWIGKKLKEAKAMRKTSSAGRSVSYQSGLAAAFGGVRTLPPLENKGTGAPPTVPPSTDPAAVLKQSLVAFLKRPGRCSRETIELGMALLDELRG